MFYHLSRFKARLFHNSICDKNQGVYVSVYVKVPIYFDANFNTLGWDYTHKAKMMGKPTILDVARAANVSPATVDRALNGRGSVSQNALNRIGNAAKKLGYHTTSGKIKAALRPTAHLRMILPIGDYGFLRNIKKFARSAARQCSDVDVNLEIVALPMVPEELIAALDKAVEDGCDAVAVFAIDVPVLREKINQLEKQGITVITMVSDLPSSARKTFVGIDNYAAGRTAARLMGKFLRSEKGTVAVLVGSMSIRDHMERYSGFREVISTKFRNLDLVPAVETQSLNDANYDAVIDLSKAPGDLVGIYMVTGGVSGVLAATREIRRDDKPVIIAHELTSVTRSGLISGEIDVIINQSAERIAKTAVRHMVEAALPEQDFELVGSSNIDIEVYVQDNLPS